MIMYQLQQILATKEKSLLQFLCYLLTISEKKIKQVWLQSEQMKRFDILLSPGFNLIKLIGAFN
jgi:hypothetical protein